MKQLTKIELTAAQYFKSLKIIHFAMVFGQVLFSLIIIFLVYQQGSAGRDELSRIFLIIIPALMLLAIAGSTALFRYRLKQIIAEPVFSVKMNAYRTSLIIKYAMLEAPALLSVIIYFLTGKWLFLAAAVFMILLQAIQNPGRSKAERDLQLNDLERMKLENPDEVVSDYTAS